MSIIERYDLPAIVPTPGDGGYVSTEAAYWGDLEHAVSQLEAKRDRLNREIHRLADFMQAVYPVMVRHPRKTVSEAVHELGLDQ